MKAGSAQAESCCVYVKPEKFMQHMHGKIPKLFDCWADPVPHLLLLKSSMANSLPCGWDVIYAVDGFEKDCIGKSDFRDPEATNDVGPSAIVRLFESSSSIGTETALD